MMQRTFTVFRGFGLSFTVLILVAAPSSAAGEPPPAAALAFHSYVGAVEARLARQHRNQEAFLVSLVAPQSESRLRQGELVLEQLTPSAGEELSGALLHHWRGTAFAAGSKAADFEGLMRSVDEYPRRFSPQVVRAGLVAGQVEEDRMRAWMRVRQHHVITVVMDMSYDITFERLDARRGYSMSRSTRISEIDSPGTAAERTLSSSEEHGFLWRLNTYWSYEERDGGLYLQVESVSLSRSIPHGMGWAVRPLVESIPRESLEFTLRSTCNALRK